MELVQIETARKAPTPKPDWLKARAPVGENYHELKRLARGLGLNTVCESAQCPNIGECWHHKTATFMMLGNLCTRRCGFCAVPKGRPEPIDFDEPRRVAEAVAKLGLEYAVITSASSPWSSKRFAASLPSATSKCSSPTSRATGNRSAPWLKHYPRY
jgi:lipoic acid synthetase